MKHEGLMDRMIIDCGKVTNIIVDFIQEKVKEEKKDGVVLGLSGGVDSAVAVILATKAMGDPSKVYALYLPDRDSEKKFGGHTQKVADKLGINFEVRDITPLVKKQGAYRSLGMRMGQFSSILNRLLLLSLFRLICYLVFRETQFSLNLKRGAPAKNKVTKVIYHALFGAIEKSFNIRHIQRRKILENYAAEKNLLLIGAANKSESFIGLFVKDGIDDLPIEVLLGLYKNQVRQLAYFLGVPPEILGEAPSPDMAKGIGDEDIVGYPYEKIDKVAYILEDGLNGEDAFNDGITPEEFESIKTLNRLSTWKRKNKHEFPNCEAGLT